MKKLKNIKQTKQAKEEYNHPIIELLFERITKEDICKVLHCSEREARGIIAECAMFYPVIALSNKKGYRLARKIDELSLEGLVTEYDIVNNACRELNSRIKCLKKRLKPLIAWKKVAEKKVEELR